MPRTKLREELLAWGIVAPVQNGAHRTSEGPALLASEVSQKRYDWHYFVAKDTCIYYNEKTLRRRLFSWVLKTASKGQTHGP